MKESTCVKPAIFAMSNPTTNGSLLKHIHYQNQMVKASRNQLLPECTPQQAFDTVGSHIIFASGSPFPDVDLGNGRIGRCNQGNNMYLFPGIGLGTLLSGARIISDGMLQAAAECLAAYMKDEEVLQGTIYPSISSIRDITKEVAAAVVREAVAEELAEGYHDKDAKELRRMSKFGNILATRRFHALGWPSQFLPEYFAISMLVVLLIPLYFL
eukprot:Gb_34480 [translate_table: standard]